MVEVFVQQHSRHRQSEGSHTLMAPGNAFKVVAAAAAMVTALTTSQAWALALGRASVQSVLGEPLRAEIDVPSITDSEAGSLQLRIAPAERFQAANMQFNPLLSDVRFELVRQPDGRFVIRLSSERTVSEPFLDVMVQANWANGQLTRGYTLLIDPPSMRPAPAPILLLPVATPEPTTPQTPADAAVSASAAPVVPAAVTPAPAPVRRAPQPTAPAQTAATTPSVQVERGDTAGAIARQHLPAGVSLDQMLIALLRTNPSAFTNNNVNRLRAGAILQLPDGAAASAIPASEARQLVQAQSRDFNEYRRRLAGLATTQATPAATRQSQGQVQTEVADQQPTATAQDRLQLAQGTANPADDQIAQARQADATQQRAEELNRNLRELERLRAEASAVTEAAPPVAPEAAASAAPEMPATPAVAVEQAPSVPPPVEADQPPSLVESVVQHPMTLPVAGGLLALLGGLVWWQRRRGHANTADPHSSEADIPAPAQAQGQTVDTGNDAPVSSMMYSPSQLDAGGDVDPVAEADVYLAYGRDKQAEEILAEALRLHPERLPARLKLLEIHALRNDVTSFNAEVQSVYALTAGEGPEWEQARELGLRIDPDNALYRIAAAPDTNPPPVADLASVPPDIDLNFGDDAPAPERRDESPDFDLDLTELESAIAQAPPAVATRVELPDEVKSISLDLDTAFEMPTSPPAPPPQVSAGSDLMAGLELDESMGLNDPLQTKLSLAEEFQAIGDTDGARSLAEEVEAEASGELKAKARAFLSQLS